MGRKEEENEVKEGIPRRGQGYDKAQNGGQGLKRDWDRMGEADKEWGKPSGGYLISHTLHDSQTSTASKVAGLSLAPLLLKNVIHP